MVDRIVRGGGRRAGGQAGITRCDGSTAIEGRRARLRAADPIFLVGRLPNLLAAQLDVVRNQAIAFAASSVEGSLAPYKDKTIYLTCL